MKKPVNNEVGVLTKSIRSGKWLGLSTVVQKIISFGSFFILARILAPADFGIITIILMVASVVDDLTSHGIETSMAQSGEDPEPYWDIVWTLNVVKSTVFALAIVLAAPLIADFFHVTAAVNLVRAAGLLILIGGFSNVRLMYLFINLDFKKIFWRDLMGQLAYPIIAIGYLLFIQTSVWALLLGHIARIFTGLVMSYWLYPKMPKFSFKFSKLWRFVSYSKWIAGQNIIAYFSSLIGQFYVGRLLGPEKLGFYAKANDISLIGTSSVVSIIRKVGFYAYNAVQVELKKIQDGFIKSLDIILFITLPVAFFLLIEGGTIVAILLGQKWLTLVLPLKILAVAAIFNSLSDIASPLFDSIGKAKINFFTTLLRLGLALPLFYIGAVWRGIAGVAIAALVISLLILIYTVWQARPVLRLGKDRILPSLAQLALALAPVLLLGVGWRSYIHQFNSNILIVGWIFVLGLIYLAGIWFVGKKATVGPYVTLRHAINELRGNFRS